jgi:uncharacterized protein (DUF2141 family)
MKKLISRKTIFILLLLLFSTTYLTAENVRVTIDITHVTVNDGKVFLAIFSNADEFRREEPPFVFELESTSTVLSQEVQLPPGEYVISAFQDRNGNNDLDFNFLGVPREPVGISNYYGSGFPSRNFDRQKIPINSTTERVSIRLYRFM